MLDKLTIVTWLFSRVYGGFLHRIMFRVHRLRLRHRALTHCGQSETLRRELRLGSRVPRSALPGPEGLAAERRGWGGGESRSPGRRTTLAAPTAFSRGASVIFLYRRSRDFVLAVLCPLRRPLPQ